MKPKLYLETSTISYLIARPSRDLVVAANQQVTHDWWETPRSQFQLYTSQVVIDEVSEGEPDAITQRLNKLKDIPLLELKTEALELAKIFIQQQALPVKASQDALHIAVATIYGLDYLLTWNCKHIANATLVKKIAWLAMEQGYELPTICTPYELMGE
jgi:predicted nucleic acid-binding protein